MKSSEDKQRIITKFNEIQEEILKIGWNGIINKYHPDMNCDNANAAKMFKLYKRVYEDMRKRMILQG